MLEKYWKNMTAWKIHNGGITSLNQRETGNDSKISAFYSEVQGSILDILRMLS